MLSECPIYSPKNIGKYCAVTKKSSLKHDTSVQPQFLVLKINYLIKSSEMNII